MLKQLLLIGWLLLFATMAAAEGPPAETGGGSDPETTSAQVAPESAPAPGLFSFRRLDGVQRYLSNNVEELARRIDAFFGDERAYAEGSGTYVQARGSAIYSKGGDFSFDNQLKGRLDLPNLQKRFSLVIESDTNDTIADTRNTTGEPTVRESLNNQQLEASLQMILREAKLWDVRLQPGIRLRLPPKTFVRLRMRRHMALGETWLARFTLTPGWYDERGWEARGVVDLERATGQGALFRASSEVVWLYDEPDNAVLAEVLSFAHPISAKEKMAYSTGVTAETYPSWVATSYFANIRYRRNILHDWLFFELKPQIMFAREDKFRPDPSLAVSLEILFGSRYLTKPSIHP